MAKYENETLWHSAAHIMAAAVKKLYPKARFGIGPPVENGFYYDIDNISLKEEDLEKIEKEIKNIIKANLKFERKEVSLSEVKNIFKDEPYKLELIEDRKDQKLTIYKLGDFIDLCKGPHVKYSKEVKFIKLTKLAGAYWKADSNNPMLTRVYGIAFQKKEDLNNYFKLLEEAEKRDHRKLGTQLDLFSVHDETGPGLPLFHPKGTILFNLMRDYWEDIHKKAGYVLVNTPHVYKLNLWKQSGHWDNYRENMFLTEYGGDDFGVKPMNCPGHMYIYNSSSKSYRDFPIRMGEMGVVYRCELSGTLSGLFRVIKITQDDAHIFCREDQVESELKNVIELVFQIYKDFGFKDFHIELSTRPEKSIGSDEIWEMAESTLKKVLKSKKIDYQLNPGDGAFYGPKIDFHIKDALGRSWQCGTLQLDFSMPERFNLTYKGKDNKEHKPVMLHRTIFGSFERFMGILIEHFAGDFPTWLAPVQARVLSFTDRNIKYGEKIFEELEKAGIRVEKDFRSDTVQYKVREAELQKIPYIITVGDKEEESQTLAVRDRSGKVKFKVKAKDFIKQINKEIESKK